MKAGRQIIIVEDDRDDEVLLMRQLRLAQLESHVRVIRDGAKALAHLQNENSDSAELAAIFLDLKLPKVGGLEILEAIRASDRLKNIPVIVMTSSNAPEHLERCQQLGVSCFVQKPLTFSSFAKAFADTFQAQQEQTGTRNISLTAE